MEASTDRARRQLLADERETAAQRGRLIDAVEEIVRASESVATDDEHDPEGATIAFERSKASALVALADGHLADVREALRRLDLGTYATCERCAGEISAARLEARPAVRTCIRCASSPSPRR